MLTSAGTRESNISLHKNISQKSETWKELINLRFYSEYLTVAKQLFSIVVWFFGIPLKSLCMKDGKRGVYFGRILRPNLDVFFVRVVPHAGQQIIMPQRLSWFNICVFDTDSSSNQPRETATVHLPSHHCFCLFSHHLLQIVPAPLATSEEVHDIGVEFS